MFNMVRGTVRSPSSVVLALMTMLPLVAQAADSPIAWATTHVTGLQYTLVDLDPADGLAPSVTFNGDFALSSALIPSAGDPIYSGSLLPTSSLMATGPGSTAEASASGWSLKSTVTLDDVMSQIDLTQHTEQTIFIERYASIGFTHPTDSSALGITLGAKTGIFITGVVNIAGHVDNAPLEAALAPFKIDNPFTSGYSLSGAMLDIRLSWAEAPPTDDLFLSEVGSDAWFYLSAGQLVGASEPSFNHTKGFAVQLANMDVVSKEATFDISAGAATETFAFVTPSAEVPAVPEPSTWAMLAGGLISLGLVRRRQRR